MTTPLIIWFVCSTIVVLAYLRWTTHKENATDYEDFLHWLDAEKGALRDGFRIEKLVKDYLNE